MTFDTNHEFPSTNIADFIAAATLPTKVRAKRKQVNYKSKDSKKTLERQFAILTWMALAPNGLNVTDIASSLGISRQLCLYHLKKMAAKGLILMMLEPCEGNGGLRYRCWDEMQLAARYARKAA